MKDYEKAAVAIGVAALGLAAYQAMQAKKAVDAQEATDPGKNPVSTTIDLAKNVIGSTTSWFRQRYDDATGKKKGRSEDVIDSMSASPASPFYLVKKAIDFGRDATETGSKYLWNATAGANASGKKKLEGLTNKPFTLMGAFAEKFTIARPIPAAGQVITNAITGVGSKLEFVEKKTGGVKDRIKETFFSVKDRLFRMVGR